MEATANRIEEEKMAIVIQKIVGRRYDDLYYPDFSGVARSVNFFPVSDMKPDDGVAYVALGLGKAIMEGENVLQFSPKYPEIIPQFYSGDFSIKNTQREFYAVDISQSDKSLNWNDTQTLKRAPYPALKKTGP